MDQDSVILSVPATAAYARSVRMLAASLAVSDEFSVDDVEDVRMAAEEGFVYACGTKPASGSCEISFGIAPGEVTMDFVLGDGVDAPEEGDETAEGDGGFDLVELLLSAICDDYSLIDYEDEEGPFTTLHLVKRAGARE